MNELIGYWSDAALHGGHSYWAYAFKADGTGFFEFTNFSLVNFQPIRWSVQGNKLEIVSDTLYTVDDLSTDTFASEPCADRVSCTFRIQDRPIDGRPMRVLSLDLRNAEAPDFAKRFYPEEYGFRAHIKVDKEYDPVRRRKA